MTPHGSAWESAELWESQGAGRRVHTTLTWREVKKARGQVTLPNWNTMVSAKERRKKEERRKRKTEREEKRKG